MLAFTSSTPALPDFPRLKYLTVPVRTCLELPVTPIPGAPPPVKASFAERAVACRRSRRRTVRDRSVVEVINAELSGARARWSTGAWHLSICTTFEALGAYARYEVDWIGVEVTNRLLLMYT